MSSTTISSASIKRSRCQTEQRGRAHRSRQVDGAAFASAPHGKPTRRRAEPSLVARSPSPLRTGLGIQDLMTSRSTHRWSPAIALVVLSLIWGYTWVLAKQGLAYAPPFAFAAERCVGGALSLFLVLKLLGRRVALVAPRETLAIGLAQVTGFMAFQTWALVAGGPGKTAVLIFTMPIWTLLMAWPILGERIRGPQWLAAASTLAGLTLIVEPWNMHTSLFSKFLGIMAALSWASGTILLTRLRARHEIDLLSLTAWQMVLGAVPLVILAVVVPERPTEWTMHYMVILSFMAVGS